MIKTSNQMGYCTTADLKVVCIFDLKELDDWKYLCAMFKDESCKELLSTTLVFDLIDPKPKKGDDPIRTENSRPFSEETVQEMSDFFKSVEPQLVDKVDLLNLHQQLFELCDGPEDWRFETLPKDKILCVELFTELGSGEIWGRDDCQNERHECSSLAELMESLATINAAFTAAGIPDGWVTINIDMHSG
jgi:hypothetical protein